MSGGERGCGIGGNLAMIDADHIIDLFASFGRVSVRRMFGGAGIYRDGTMFALVAGKIIYLKAGEGNAAAFDAEGLEPFSYTARNGKRAVMSYRRMPDRLYDDPEELAHWAAQAFAQARRAPQRTKRAAPALRTARRRRLTTR